MAAEPIAGVCMAALQVRWPTCPIFLGKLPGPGKPGWLVPPPAGPKHSLCIGGGGRQDRGWLPLP